MKYYSIIYEPQLDKVSIETAEAKDSLTAYHILKRNDAASVLLTEDKAIEVAKLLSDKLSNR